MTILANDIKLLASDHMTDAPEGGGAMTGQVIVDGLSNNIFDDISTLDRVYGAVHMRKAFGAVQTLTADKYYGGHLIIARLPGDKKLGINLFNTGDWFDRRTAAQSRVENYRAQGVIYQGFLWGTQYQGSRSIAIFQSENAPIPGIGDVLMMVSVTASQYVRIVRMTHSVQSFTTDQGEFKRRILEIEISDVLTHDFVGAQMNKFDNLNPDAKLFKTVVANAARYYSARPLKTAAQAGDLSVKVDTVYSQVVPSSQAEVALVDISASGSSAPVIDAASGLVNFTTSVNFSANSSLHLGNACLPGSLSIPVSGGTLTDDGGDVKSGAVTVGTIEYTTGIISFAANAPTYTGSKTVSFRPACAPIRVSDTASIRVTAANRGFVWTINLNAPPKPKALRISYRALDKWYELYDNGKGGIIAQQAGIGSGTINYITGSAALTLGAMPDANSDILFSWGQQADFFNRANLAVGSVKVRFQLAQLGFAPATLTITWNDGVARTATCNAAGVISGHASGQLNLVSGLLEFTPLSLPLGGTVFTVNYNYGTAVTKTLTGINPSGNNISLDLGDTNITPNSLKVSWQAPWEALPAHITPTRNGVVSVQDSDNGSGTLIGGRSSTINYAAGTLTFSHVVNAPYKATNFGLTMTIGAVSA